MGYSFLGRRPSFQRSLEYRPSLFFMSYFQYHSQIETDCLISSFKSLLEEAGLLVSEEFSTTSQLFAETFDGKTLSNSKVKILISWADKSSRVCLIEVRSDEPHLRKDTFCERVANQLRDLIPAKEVSSNFIG